ncbi:MAG: hypothetical protein J5647_07095 [Spirochaetaceae bacterium]|nr:hypothetical protein [Spirochaetaceae bacterium]
MKEQNPVFSPIKPPDFKKFDSVDKYIFELLKFDFDENIPNSKLYYCHVLENLDMYRNTQSKNVTVTEHDRYIRLVYSPSSDLPKIQIMINKDNNMANRVYVSDNETELGDCFYISDSKVFKLLNLSDEKIALLRAKASLFKKEKERKK